jgi:hypothetical protein
VVSEKFDYAVLWIDAPADIFVGAEFAYESLPKVGNRVYAVGNAYGKAMDGSVSTGIISQVGIDTNHWPVADQITTATAPGCSGGPLFSAVTHKIIGLVVGRWEPFGCFVPIRVLAKDRAYHWALWGKYCPTDDTLNKAAEIRELEIELKQVPDLPLPPTPHE